MRSIDGESVARGVVCFLLLGFSLDVFICKETNVQRVKTVLQWTGCVTQAPIAREGTYEHYSEKEQCTDGTFTPGWL